MAARKGEEHHNNPDFLDTGKPQLINGEEIDLRAEITNVSLRAHKHGDEKIITQITDDEFDLNWQKKAELAKKKAQENKNDLGI